MTMLRQNLRAPIMRTMAPMMMTAPGPAPTPTPTTPAPTPTVPAGAQLLLCTPQPTPPSTGVSRALTPFTPTSAWSSNLFTRQQLTGTGQVVVGDTWTMLASTLGLVGTGLGAYHGYKRTGSVGWTIAWALLGGLFPIITIPVAFAQGFGRAEPSFRSGRSR